MTITARQTEALARLIARKPSSWKACVRFLWENSDRVQSPDDYEIYRLRGTEFNLTKAKASDFALAVQSAV